MEQSNQPINQNGNRHPLKTDRKTWVVYLLTIITFGIYGIVVMYDIAKETNVSCKEDGLHTRNFLGAILLSIVTLGIYMFVWSYKWAEREYRFLERNSPDGGLMKGVTYLFLMIVNTAVVCMMQFFNYEMQWAYSYSEMMTYSWLVIICSIINIGWSIYLISRYLKQHNAVNRVYNLKAFGANTRS